MANKNLLGNYSDPTGVYTFDGLGLVPVGGIIAIGDAGAWALPASGAIKDGWALCNGQVKPVGSAAGLAANLPDLTDDRFLNGSTAAGGTGGATAKTTTGIAASFAKNLLNADQIAHIHGMQHFHQWGSQTVYGSAPQLVVTAYDINATPVGFLATYNNYLAAGSNYSLTDTITYNGTFFTGSAKVIGSTTDRTHTDSQTVSWLAGPTVSTTVTQGTISDIRPKYFNVVYVMRVK